MREDIVRAHNEALFRRAVALSGDRSDALDLVQDTWERAIRRYTDTVGESKLRGWLFVIMRNIQIDNVRYRKARKVVAATTSAVDTLPAPDPDPEAPWTRLTFAEVQMSLTDLPPPLRTAYEMRAVERRSYAEISRVLNIPRATVGTRLLRARKRLRQLVTEPRSSSGPPRKLQRERNDLDDNSAPMIDKRAGRDGRHGTRSPRAMVPG